MTRYTALTLVALCLPMTAWAEDRPGTGARWDRIEDRLDRLESRRDRQVTLGRRDLIEDRVDAWEDRRDRQDLRVPAVVQRWERRSWHRRWH